MALQGAGVMFVASGEAHVAAARAAALSVRATNPGLPIAIFSDAAEPLPEFDQVVSLGRGRARSKVDALDQTPFERTLYLDTDTRVRGDLDEMFRLLDRFDLGVAQVTRAYKKSYLRSWRADVPSTFPQHNGGVILYRSTPLVLNALRGWRESYDAAGVLGDQMTFREMLWTSDLRLCVLPERYNLRRFDLARRLFSSAPAPVILHMNRFNPAKRRWFHRLLDPVLGS